MIHKSIIAAAALATSAMVPSAASATSFAFAGANNTNGSVGNVMTFTGNDNTKVEVSAYSLNGTNLTKATLKQYSGYGLGITNSGNDGDHEIDNSGWIDFVVLQFDRVVSVSSLGIFGFGDTDLTWAVGTTTTSFTPDALSFANYVAFDNAFGTFTPSAGDVSSKLLTRSVNGTALTGNLFLVAASMTGENNNDRSNDSFKLNNLISTPAVPEPATWGMMMMGLGLAGAMMRRSKANTAVSFA